jgi:hypothetical protein
MRLIDPWPEILLVLVSFWMSGMLWMASPDAPGPEMKWCDQRGWSGMLDGKCMGVTMDPIPLPSAGTCPGAYVLWTYDPNKPAICVRKA